MSKIIIQLVTGLVCSALGGVEREGASVMTNILVCWILGLFKGIKIQQTAHISRQSFTLNFVKTFNCVKDMKKVVGVQERRPGKGDMSV